MCKNHDKIDINSDKSGLNFLFGWIQFSTQIINMTCFDVITEVAACAFLLQKCQIQKWTGFFWQINPKPFQPISWVLCELGYRKYKFYYFFFKMVTVVEKWQTYLCQQCACWNNLVVSVKFVVTVAINSIYNVSFCITASGTSSQTHWLFE